MAVVIKKTAGGQKKFDDKFVHPDTLGPYTAGFLQTDEQTDGDTDRNGKTTWRLLTCDNRIPALEVNPPIWSALK